MEFIVVSTVFESFLERLVVESKECWSNEMFERR